MKIVAIADIHSKYRKTFDNLVEGDTLVIAGDITRRGRLGDLNSFLGKLAKHRKMWKHVVMIAGNHDHCFAREDEKEIAFTLMDGMNITYLEDSGATLDGVKFYGSPYAPKYGNWSFYLMRQSPELVEKWKKIPDDTDVLITHGPPYGVLDSTISGHRAGCEILRRQVEWRVKPKAHIFGHIHEGYGSENFYYNVSTNDAFYAYKNPPMIIEV